MEDAIRIVVRAAGPELRLVGDLGAGVDDRSQNAMLICSPRSMASPTVAQMRDQWKGRLSEGPPVRSHAPIDDVNAVLAHIREVQPDLLVAVGGGSVVDAAKIASAHGLRGELDVESLVGEPESRIPVLAFPTTFAAAEHTTVVGVSVGPKKVVLRGPWFAVDTAVYAPSAFRDVPRGALRDSAVNGFVHAIECAYSRAANPISDALSRTAAAAFWQSLPGWWGGRDDLLEGMVRAGIQAGFALRDVGVGIIHAIGHVVGTRFGVSHGASNAAALVPGMAVNLEDPGALRVVSETLSLPAEKEAIMDALAQWLSSLELPSTIRAPSADVSHLLSELANDFTLPTNPVEVGREDFARAVEMLFGASPTRFHPDQEGRPIGSANARTSREA